MKLPLDEMKNPDQFKKTRCAGIVVYRFLNDVLQFALVKTKKGRYSFPKGKREKGETAYNCALRETEEETGLRFDQLQFVKHGDGLYFYSEYSKKKELSVTYFLAEAITDSQLIPQDPDELEWAGWLDYKTILSLSSDEFKPRRLAIVKSAKTLLTDI